MLKPYRFDCVTFQNSFFSVPMKTARTESIPYMWAALNDAIPGIPPSGCIHNFRIAANEIEGEFFGFPWQDSDLWKWIEGAAYSLATVPDEKLREQVNNAIALARRAQQPDGYLNTFYIVNGLPRFTNLKDCHELYVAGHLMEAACAWYEAAGEDNLLQIACHEADCLDRFFGPGEKQCHGYPGHQEVELGLARLYQVTGKSRYIQLAKYFLDVRGHQPHYFDQELIARGDRPAPRSHRPLELPYSYHQAHMPVREQKEAIGHAVRQCYMLAGMAEVGALTEDQSLIEAANCVFLNIIEKQMYITGGVGSTHIGESFSFNYDLPADRCYTETCASIALIMTAVRLNRICPNGLYGDIIEKALYNGILSGISLDGTKYFYMNPLEVWQERVTNRNDLHIDGERQGWFGCACCPPNILRTLTGLSAYLGAYDDQCIYIDQYISSHISADLMHGTFSASMRSFFPWEGDVSIQIEKAPSTTIRLFLRSPGWARSIMVHLNGHLIIPEVNSGYLILEQCFKNGDIIRLSFPMPIEKMQASLHSPDYAGKCAIMRGPLVYCLEEKDNGKELWALSLDDCALRPTWAPDLLNGVMVITGEGKKELLSDTLYSSNAPHIQATPLTFVPYYAWGNRGKGNMSVWVRK